MVDLPFNFLDIFFNQNVRAFICAQAKLMEIGVIHIYYTTDLIYRRLVNIY